MKVILDHKKRFLRKFYHYYVELGTIHLLNDVEKMKTEFGEVELIDNVFIGENILRTTTSVTDKIQVIFYLKIGSVYEYLLDEIYYTYTKKEKQLSFNF